VSGVEAGEENHQQALVVLEARLASRATEDAGPLA
jgi:hypothetical protein